MARTGASSDASGGEGTYRRWFAPVAVQVAGLERAIYGVVTACG